MQVRKERRMLMRLDDRALQDIGFDQGRAYGEANRTFWDVPVDRHARLIPSQPIRRSRR